MSSHIDFKQPKKKVHLADMGEMDVIINTPVLVYGAQLPIDSGKVQGSGGTLRFSLSYTVHH